MLILSFAGSGENSLTLKSLEVLEHHKDVEMFDKCIIKPTFNFDKDFDSVADKMKQANVVIWAVSPFHMNIPAHLLRFFEECRKKNLYMNNLHTFFTTNIRICDTFLSVSLEKQINTITSRYIQGLSFAAPDMINQKMALYNLATPDLPQKKGLFGYKPAKFEEGEGLKTAVQWYKILKFLSSADKPVLSSDKRILLVDMDENADMHSSFILDSIQYLRDFYTEADCVVEDLAQRDYKINYCDSCKICYASKECKFKDDYLSYAEKLEKADIIIYYGRCINGFTSSISKACIDRSVKDGLMPKKGELPSEREKFQAVGYILDTEPESYAMFREWALSIASFSLRHFLGVIADIPSQQKNSLSTMGYYSLLTTQEKMMPQRNFYSSAIGQHFAMLSQNIPMVIPEEAKYYKKSGAYEPVPLEPNARTVMPETAKIGQQMRLVPYDKVIEELDKM